MKESLAKLFHFWQVSAEQPKPAAEDVHQLRVSSRRVAAALVQFGRFLPRQKTGILLRDLAAVRKSAGPARDCDVFAERLKQRDGNPESQVLVERLKEHREKAQQKLVACFVKSERGERLERRAVELLTAIRPRGRRTRQVVLHPTEWAGRQLHQSIREFFAHCNVDTQCIEQLHELRIQVKQFRYELEFLSPVLPQECAQQAIKALKKLSQRLGDINDHAAAITFLSVWLREPMDDESRKALRKARKDERHALGESMNQFGKWWTARRRRRLRSRLKDAARVDDRVA
jgi:CHAD domain-containing protein